MSPQPKRVLISAYACEPDKGSEPGVGWNWVKQVARFHEIWVITRVNNRKSIEKAMQKDPMPNANFVYFDLPKWARFCKRGQRGIHLYYYLWQIGAYFLARRLCKKICFDLAHHLTFSICWVPSLISLLPLPFIWGPVGGVEPFPKMFLRNLSLKNRSYERLKDLALFWGSLDPFVRITAKRAALILAQTTATANYLSEDVGAKIIQFPAVGLEDDLKIEEMGRKSNGVFRIISVGRLLYFKGFDLSIKAFAQFSKKFPNSEYHVIGDGPERASIEKLAFDLGIHERVTLFGSLPRAELLRKLTDCDLMLHTSLRDPPVYVLLEAMAAGLPIVCIDLGGPALQVTETTGVKVTALSPKQTVEDLAKAILLLAQDPDLRARMGEAGRRRVRERYVWQRKGLVLEQIYEKIINGSELLPELEDELTRLRVG
jgi:glycosyltransferase involved in cell wall biosynthesis